VLAFGSTVLLGTPLGLALLAWLYGGAAAVGIETLRLHAAVQLFGFLGTLIAGVAHHLLPRFTGREVRRTRLVPWLVALLAAAVALRGAWVPGNRIAEHKTLSYAAWRLAQRDAEAAGADHALLLDRDGRMGEAAVANVFCALGDEVVTAPADGLLPGVARAICIPAVGAGERAAEEREWRSAREIVAVNAVRGATAITAVDGAPVGDGAPGPLARALAEALAAAA